MNTKLDHNQRNDLVAALAPLTKDIAKLERSIAPTTKKIRKLVEARDAVLESYGIDISHDELEECEGCGSHILPGDLAHYCADGPVLCFECAPTWSEVRAQLVEEKECGLDDRDEEDAQAVIDGIAVCDAHIAAGDGDKKHVW